MSQPEPIREVVLSQHDRVYISDVGCLVIEQRDGPDDSRVVLFDPRQLKALIAAISALAESCAAKEAAYDATIDAMLKADGL